MKTYNFDFNLSCWVRAVSVDANSYEEALQKLNAMSVSDIISEGSVHSYDISTVDYTIENDEDEDDDFEFDDDYEYVDYEDNEEDED